MNPEKVVLIEPPVSLGDIYGGMAKASAVSPPMNLLLLAAIIRNKGFDPVIIDCPALGLSYYEVVERLKKLGPRYVGITAMTPHIIQANKLAEAIKNEIPDVIIILGGAHMTAVPLETMRQFPAIDIGAVGEADNSLPELLYVLNKGESARSVKGFMVREKDDVVYTGERAEKVNMDELPLYAWDILEGFPLIYKTPLFAAHRNPATPIITSRGCPGKCIYCFSGCHATIATYSAHYIFTMLMHLKEQFGIKEFQIYDDNFTMYRKNLKKLLTMIIEKQLNMTWSCNARADMIDEEILDLMERAGCWQISIGIETGNEKIMESLNKNITREKVVKTIELCRKAGIRTVGYFMIGHFGETEETIEETVNFAIDIGLEDFRMSFFTPLPGTAANQMADQHGEFDNNWEKMTVFSPVFVPNGLSRQYLIEAQKKALRKFFFRPRIIASYLKMVKNPVVALKGACAFGSYVFSSGKHDKIKA